MQNFFYRIELEKEITLFNNRNSIKNCFEGNYNGEILETYNLYSNDLETYIKPYLEKGYNFIIYLENSDTDFINSNNLLVTNDFYTFYKQSDLFIIELFLIYEKLFKQICDITEKILSIN